MSPTTNRVLIDTHDVDAALAKAAKTLEATYDYPLQMHGSMGASAGMASVEGKTATVWSSTQGVYQLRGAIATALGIPAQNIHVALRRGLGLLRAERRRQRRARRGRSFAGDRQARARAVHARGRAQVGELRPAVPDRR